MKLTPCAAIALTCLAAAPLKASEFTEMNRMEPVPATEQIPIIDFVRPDLFQQVQLNHTGTQIGAIVPGDNDHTNLITYELATKKLDGIGAPHGDRDISYFTWLDSNRLAYIISEKKMGGRHLILSEAGKLANSEEVAAAGAEGGVAILANTPEDRTQLLVDLSGSRLRYDHPELIDVVNHGALVARYPELKTDHGFDMNFIPDKLAKLAFGVTQEDGILTLSKLVGDSWVKCPENLDEIELVDAGDNPGDVTVMGPRDGKAPRPLEFMDAQTGKAGDVLLEEKSYDFNGWLFRDPLSHSIVGVVSNRAAPTVVWFTEAYRDLQKAVDALFPGQVVRILSLDDSGKIVLIQSGTDRQPAVYSWVDLGKHTSGLIKNSQPWIDPKRMRPMGVIKYKTAEGRQLDAYITLPASASKANPPPLVVLLHPFVGGRSVWQYDSEVQFLASRGYAVLQPNYRGSAGYGWMFPEQDEWEFGKMSDDVTRATKTTLAMGLADPRRVAIMGVAFGGFLAASGAANEPGLYKCVLSISSYFDWGRYIKADKYSQYSNAVYSRFLHKLGDPDRDPQKFDAFAPLRHADKVTSAMFITWGEFDDPELIGQSKDMASAVERNHVQVETMSFLDEAFGVRHLSHKMDLYSHIESFLSKNL